MNKLNILLQQLHIDTNQAFSQADITRVVVHHDSRYTFYISSPELMPLSNVKALKEAQHLFLIHVNSSLKQLLIILEKKMLLNIVIILCIMY